MRSWDAIVVGGGPAGSATAIHAARNGLRVLLLEGQGWGREKVCGGVLAPRGIDELRALGLCPEALGAQVLSQVRVVAPSGRAVSCPLRPASLFVPRRVLDASLLERAAQCGAEVRTRAWVAGAEALAHGRWRVHIRSPGGSQRGHCEGDVLVAADGAACRLDRCAGLSRSRHHRRLEGIGLQSSWELAGSERRELEGSLELHVFPGGYAGLCLTANGSAHLCLWLRRGQPGGRAAHRVLRLMAGNPALAHRFARARQLEPWKAIPVYAPGMRLRGGLGGGRASRMPAYGLVGDAAARVTPFLGLGISHALVSGRAAAGSLARWLGAGQSAGGAGACGRWIAPRVLASHLLGLVVARAAFAELAAALLAFHPRGLRALVGHLHG